MNGDDIMVVENNGNDLQLMDKAMLLSEDFVAESGKQSVLFRGLKVAAIRGTTPNDWCDQNGRPYLQDSGISIVSTAFGVRMENLKITKDDYEDEKGKYYIFYASATFSWRGRTRECEGSSTTRDQFFGTVSKCNKCGSKNVYIKEKRCMEKGCTGQPERVFKPLHEIEIVNVRKKAQTNLEHRGITKLLGLSFTYEDLEKADIDISQITKITYAGKGGSKQKKSEMTETKQKLKTAILELCGGDEAGAKTYLENLTKFTGKDGGEVPGVQEVEKLTDNRTKFAWSRVEKTLEVHRKKNGLSTAGSGGKTTRSNDVPF